MSTVNELVLELLHKEVTQLRVDLAAERESRKQSEETRLAATHESVRLTGELTSEREAHATTCRELQKVKSERDEATEERNHMFILYNSLINGVEDNDRLPYATVPVNTNMFGKPKNGIAQK